LYIGGLSDSGWHFGTIRAIEGAPLIPPPPFLALGTFPDRLAQFARRRPDLQVFSLSCVPLRREYGPAGQLGPILPWRLSVPHRSDLRVRRPLIDCSPGIGQLLAVRDRPQSGWTGDISLAYLIL